MVFPFSASFDSLFTQKLQLCKKPPVFLIRHCLILSFVLFVGTKKYIYINLPPQNNVIGKINKSYGMLGMTQKIICG